MGARAGFWSGLPGAHHRLRCRPGEVATDEAARVGLGAGHRADEFAARYQGRGLWRAVLWTVRRQVLWYAVVGVFVVALAPLVPWALRHTLTVVDHQPSRAVGWALLLSAAIAAEAMVRWLATCHVRRLIGLIELVTQRLVFRRLQVVDQRWLRERGVSTLTYLVTYPQQLSQLAFLVEFVVNVGVVGVLAGYLLVTFGLPALWVLAAVAAATVVLQRLVVLTNRAEYAHLLADQERGPLIETLSGSWQSVRRQHLEGQLLVALARVRGRQRRLLRRRTPVAVASNALQDSLVPLVSVVGVGAVLLTSGTLPAADAFAVLAAVRALVLVVRQNLDTYDCLRDAAESTPAIDALFTVAPTVSPPPSDGLADGEVRLGQYHIKPGQRVMVVGRTGCGKTTLLHRLADCRTPDQAALDVGRGGSAVLVGRGQPPLDGRIAEVATLWRRPVDEPRYRAALARCGLAGDLAGRPGGDHALLSASTVRLSEGQTARLALAQAVYTAPDVLLLDDVFAPIDPERTQQISEQLLAPGSDQPTRVFVTSRLEQVHHADLVLLLGPTGPTMVTPAELAAGPDTDLEATLGTALARQLRLAALSPPPAAVRPVTDQTVAAARQHTFAADPPVIDDEAFEPPPQRRPTWCDFLRNGAALFSWPQAVGLAGAVLVFVAADLAISATVGSPTGTDSLDTLAGLGLVALLAAGTRYLISFLGPVDTLDRVHTAIIRSLLRKSVRDGRAAVAGRLTRDFYVLEAQAPNRYVRLLAGLAQSAAVIGIVLVGNPATVVLLVPVGLGGLLAYRHSRDVIVHGSALISAVRAPLLNFATAVIGCEAYRHSAALRAALSDRFDDLAELRASALLRYNLAGFRAILLVELTGLAVFGTALWGVVLGPRSTPVAAGLVVFIAYTFTAELMSLVQRLQDVDSLSALFARLGALTATGAVLPSRATTRREIPTSTRDLYRSLLDSDPPRDTDTGRPAICASSISATASDDHLVLRPLDLQVPSGSSIVISGPSGVGKSTLLEVLSGYRHPHTGTIRLHGHQPDVLSTLTRQLTRYVQSDIPQLALPIRDFLDPWHHHTTAYLSEQLVDLFATAGLRLPGLDEPVNNTSHGQRQLLNLLRAMLGRPRVLFLDEATSALDPVDERRTIQHLHRCLSAPTSIVVLHRTDNHDCFDTVIPMRATRNVERALSGFGQDQPISGT